LLVSVRVDAATDAATSAANVGGLRPVAVAVCTVPVWSVAPVAACAELRAIRGPNASASDARSFLYFIA